MIRDEVDQLLNNPERRKQISQDYVSLEEILGGGGASKKVAQSLLKTIR